MKYNYEKVKYVYFYIEVIRLSGEMCVKIKI